jgi:hypothetical protein
MLLNEDEVEKYLINISSGKKLVCIDNKFLTFKYPDNLVKQKAEIIYDNELEEAVKGGLLLKKDLQKLIDVRELFSEDDQKKLNRLESKLEGQKVLLAKTTVVKANQERIKKIINEIQTEINELNFKKSSKLSMSAEVRANEERSLFLCWACTFNENDELYWPDFKSFKCTKDINHRDKILTDFLKFYFGLPTNIVRFIARNNLWRIRYVSSQKVSDPLFGVPTSEYTSDMLSLAYWSNYYDNIYQMMPEDRPSDLVIEDDQSLDAYMKSYYEERNREDASRRSKKKSTGKLSAFDQEEVIVTASNELYQDIEYSTPRESQRIKDRIDIKKKVKRG